MALPAAAPGGPGGMPVLDGDLHPAETPNTAAGGAILEAISEITISPTNVTNIANAIVEQITASGGALSEEQTNWLHWLAAHPLRK